jgi:hypothetical protein
MRSRRLCTPVLSKTLLRCCWTVCADTDRLAAICAVGRSKENEACHVTFAFGEFVRRHQQRVDTCRMGGLDDDRHSAVARFLEAGAVQDDPASPTRQGPGDRDLPRPLWMVGLTQRTAGDRHDSRGQLIAAVWKLG